MTAKYILNNVESANLERILIDCVLSNTVFFKQLLLSSGQASTYTTTLLD